MAPIQPYLTVNCLINLAAVKDGKMRNAIENQVHLCQVSKMMMHQGSHHVVVLLTTAVTGIALMPTPPPFLLLL